ncbi:MAG: tetratricopeptide repeat protein [Acidobacteriota bacterium]
MASEHSRNLKKEPRKDAYHLYEQGLKLLHEKKYQQAKSVLLEIRQGFPDNLELLARVNELLKVSDKKTGRNEKLPDDPTSLVDRGVVFHNLGEYDQAIACYKKALEKAPTEDKDYIYYAMASSEAGQGNRDKAIGYLKKAIQMKNELRFMARSDPDFEALADSSEFRELVRPQDK